MTPKVRYLAVHKFAAIMTHVANPSHIYSHKRHLCFMIPEVCFVAKSMLYKSKIGLF